MQDNELRQALQQTLSGLAHEPQTLDEIWQKYQHIWQSIGWQSQQLALWLGCQTGINKVNDQYQLSDKQAEQSSEKTPDLGDILLDIVISMKRPVAVKQALSQLPNHIVATEAMLKTAALEHPKLTMMGPMIKQA